MATVMRITSGYSLADGTERTTSDVISTNHGWESPEAAKADHPNVNTASRSRRPYLNGWEQRQVAAGREYAELNITHLWQRVHFIDDSELEATA